MARENREGGGIVLKGVMALFPDMACGDAEQMALELAGGPEKPVEEGGRRAHELSLLRKNAADAIEKTAEERDQGTDLSYAVAHSYENISNETSTLGEYFRWIEQGKSVIRHMTDGDITAADLDEKHDFVGMLNQREAELMVCLGLYRASGSAAAKARYEELALKLNKLREIRSAVNVATIEMSKGERATQEDMLLAKLYLAALSELDRLSPQQKKKLGIAAGDYSPNSWEERTYSKRLESGSRCLGEGRDQSGIPDRGGNEDFAERFLQIKRKEQSGNEAGEELSQAERMRRRLEVLSGRKSLFVARDPRADKIDEDLRKRMFDKRRYMVLNGRDEQEE